MWNTHSVSVWNTHSPGAGRAGGGRAGGRFAYNSNPTLGLPSPPTHTPKIAIPQLRGDNRQNNWDSFLGELRPWGPGGCREAADFWGGSRGAKPPRKRGGGVNFVMGALACMAAQ